MRKLSSRLAVLAVVALTGFPLAASSPRFFEAVTRELAAFIEDFRSWTVPGRRP